jgi:hypothetical protein
MLSVLEKLRTVETSKVYGPLLSLENWTVRNFKSTQVIVERFRENYGP